MGEVVNTLARSSKRSTILKRSITLALLLSLPLPAYANTCESAKKAEQLCQQSPYPELCKFSLTKGCQILSENIEKAKNTTVGEAQQPIAVQGAAEPSVIANRTAIAMYLAPDVLVPFASECAKPSIVGWCFKLKFSWTGVSVIPGLVVEYRKPVSLVTASRIPFQSELLGKLEGTLQFQAFKIIVATQQTLEYLYLSNKLFIQTLRASVIANQSVGSGISSADGDEYDIPALAEKIQKNPSSIANLGEKAVKDEISNLLPDNVLGGAASDLLGGKNPTQIIVDNATKAIDEQINQLIPGGAGGIIGGISQISGILSGLGGVTEAEKKGIKIALAMGPEGLFRYLGNRADPPMWGHAVPSFWRYFSFMPWDCANVKGNLLDRWNSAFVENLLNLTPQYALFTGGRYKTYLQKFIQNPNSCSQAGFGDSREFRTKEGIDVGQLTGIGSKEPPYPAQCLEKRSGVKVPLTPTITYSSTHEGSPYFVSAYKTLATSCEMKRNKWYGVNIPNDINTDGMTDKVGVIPWMTHKGNEISDYKCSDFSKFPSELGGFNEASNPVRPATFVHWKQFRVCISLTSFTSFINPSSLLDTAAFLNNITSAINGGVLSGKHGPGGGGCINPTFTSKKIIKGAGCE
jgi:hypothetical protein